MIATNKLKEIKAIIDKYSSVEYRIINNTFGKNLILLNKNNLALTSELLSTCGKYIQEIICEDNENEDKLFVKQIKDLCPKNSVVHKNTSYVNWNNKQNIEKIPNVIAGYSFKGGMGRSTTIAYLSYFYYFMGKKVVVLDCDFEAPGITNIFFTKEQRKRKAGILDYFVDINIEEELKLNDYFLQTEVSNKSGNLFLFPSGIDFDTENYINKISKIDFNSTVYTQNFVKLLEHINMVIKPDLIFIDLRAGINESNGLVLKNISNDNLLFFNCEGQNEDGLKVISGIFDDFQKNFIMNSTIRFFDQDFAQSKKDQLNDFLKNELNFNEYIEETLDQEFEDKIYEKRIIHIPHTESMLVSNIDDYKNFVDSNFSSYESHQKCFLSELIEIINKKYFEVEERLLDLHSETQIENIKSILEKLKDVFSNLTGTQQFELKDDLKFFYLKDDISKIINEQIFLILGAKGSGKSTLFEVFTKHHKDILQRLNIKNNTYTAGFSKHIMSDITKDYITNIFNLKALNKLVDIERFWKCLTLFQIENTFEIKDSYFKSYEEISDRFIEVAVGLDVDKRLKEINIDLLQKDKIVTLVYDELDIGFPSPEATNIFISTLISFWQDNIYKYSQIRSKILLRNDIFEEIDIENKTHLELNTYELKWNEKEILSLILKIFIATLNDNELEHINLLFIVKNRMNNEVIEDMDKIREAIYLIFNKNAPYGSTMDKWLPARLEDSKGLITPRTIYKLMFESIKNELIYDTNTKRNALLNSFKKDKEDWKNILKEVSKQKRVEYDSEYKGYQEIYQKITEIGQRSFTKDEFKSKYKKSNVKQIDEDLRKLQDSGFLGYDEKQKKYQVAFIYVYGLDLKINKSKTGLGKKNTEEKIV